MLSRLVVSKNDSTSGGKTFTMFTARAFVQGEKVVFNMCACCTSLKLLQNFGSKIKKSYDYDISVFGGRHAIVLSRTCTDAK